MHGRRPGKGLVTLAVDGKPAAKRFVIRLPVKWNGSLVIGAHGGSGGDAIDRSGKVYATTETALDDVIGDYAFAQRLRLRERRSRRHRRDARRLRADDAICVASRKLKSAPPARSARSAGNSRIYIVGLSAGGGITRMAAEATPAPFDGALIIAGAGGDVDHAARSATAHGGVVAADRSARACGTVEHAIRRSCRTRKRSARRSRRAACGRTPAPAPSPRQRVRAGTVENSTAKPSIPTIEVVGTWDDLVIREIRAYRDRVEPKDRHRLYQVEGVWHMSGDDDGVQGFQYTAESRMKLDKDVADAMGESPSYIPTVREAFDHLVRWVEKGTAPPASQTVKPGSKLR